MEIVLLDVGLITCLSEIDWEHFKQLFRAIVKGDGREGADLMIKYAPETYIKTNEIGIIHSTSTLSKLL
jgi:predicted unusual protein kinase regulating ubiquinone biosynthesis (AarF/ABC1/UbiB family)